VAKEQYLLNCSEGPSDSDTGESPNCDWYSPPPRPGSEAAQRQKEAFAAEAAAFRRSAAGQRLRERMEALVAGEE
jgi:hypothetical protein